MSTHITTFDPQPQIVKFELDKISVVKLTPAPFPDLVLAFATVEIDNLIRIAGVRVVRPNGQITVKLPAYRAPGGKFYLPTVSILNARLELAITDAVLSAWQSAGDSTITAYDCRI